MKSIFKLLGIFLFLFLGAFSVASAASVDLKGYAWGADSSPFGGVGWINFNNTSTGSNTSSGADYKVTFDRSTMKLSGYAWSEKYGYIKFGDFTEGNGKYPSGTPCKGGNNDDDKCNAQLVAIGAGYQLVGYARFCFVYQSGCSGTMRSASELGGYDGWIAFKGTNFAVSYGTSSNKFTGFAWGGGHSTVSNASYGEGSGWIKMNPTNGGVSCAVAAGADCLDDNDKPVVTITASPNPAKYNGNVTLSWTVTNIPNGCTAATSSNPANTTWDGYTPTGSSIASGSKNIGVITGPTTFTLACTYNGKTGTADVLVDLEAYTPIVTLTAPASKVYGESAQLDYTVTNIPYNCTGELYRNGTVVSGYDNISVTSDGTKSYVRSDSITINNNVITSNWEFRCTDSTPPSPARVGSATAKTTITVPTPQVTFNVKDTGTNSTTTIPCTNTGVTITYSTKDVKSGSCKAMVNNVGSDPDWGNSTSITENDSPTVHTVTTGAVTQTGNILYNLQCQKLDGALWTAGKQLARSCTSGSLAVTAASTCVTPSQMVDINYVGSGLTANTCTVSWKSAPNNKINQSSFNLHYTYPASNLTVGQTYTYTVSNCQESAYPNNTPLSQSATVDVKNTCTNPNPCTGSSYRCNPTKGPVFKEF